LGSACGIASWLACTQIMSGEINIITTGLNPPLLTGNIISVGVSLITLVVLSYAFPAKVPFQWEAFKEKISTSDEKVRAHWSRPASFGNIVPAGCRKPGRTAGRCMFS
jgi:hypothetical protein